MLPQHPQRFTVNPRCSRLRVLGFAQMQAAFLEIDIAPLQMPEFACTGGGREGQHVNVCSCGSFAVSASNRSRSSSDRKRTLPLPVRASTAIHRVVRDPVPLSRATVKTCADGRR